jgi:hypothetical protein
VTLLLHAIPRWTRLPIRPSTPHIAAREPRRTTGVLKWKRSGAAPVAIRTTRTPILCSISAVRAGVAAGVCIRVLDIGCSTGVVHARHPPILAREGAAAAAEAGHAQAVGHGRGEG